MIMAGDDVAKTFTDASIKRIADTVRRSEQGARDSAAYVAPPRMQAAAGAKVFVGTYTGDWAIGEYRTVTYTNSTNTASVKNWCMPAMGATSSAERRTVLWSKASGTNSVLEIFTDRIFVGTYTGEWYAGQEKTVTFTNSTQTATVKNWCVPATNATSGTVIWGVASGTNSVLEISQAAGTASGGLNVNVGTFTGTWETGTFHMVTYKDSTRTELVKNWCVPVTGGTGGTVLFSLASGTQSVLEISQSVSTAAQGTCIMTIGSVSLTALTGYLAAEIQVLGHNTVPCLQWYSIATCATT